MKAKKIISVVLYLVVLALLFSWLSGLFTSTGNAVPYSQVVELFQQKQVRSFLIQGDQITMSLYNPYDGKTTISTKLADPDGFREDMKALFQEQADAGVLQGYDFIAEKKATAFDLFLPLLLVGLVLLFAWAMMMGRINGAANNPLNNFGKARTVLGVPDGKKVTFDDVAGADEEKAELQEVVDFLKNPEKFTEIGARIPHGLLLVGPPGTGKTLLARAVAGEAGVQFLSISGSDFVEMYVGVGASRVRDLFEQAKKIAPSIIFIDEIDAVGRKRGSGLGGGHDEKEQTLNQLLVEMDGFGRNEGVIVMAATNRPDILDPALLRPGRFDRQIYVGAPDAKGREDILKVHAKGKRLDDSVSLKTVAMATAGFTGADLSNLLNEAAILAARNNRPALNMDDLNEAMMKIMAGPEKKSRVNLKRDLRATAIHEAGHAVAMYNLPTHDPVRQISIIPRGQALGLTWSMPREDSSHLTRNQMYEQIVGLLGGRVAEALFLGDISTGASNDIDRASKLARDMVARYGMCEKLGTVSYLSGGEVFIGRDYQQTKSYSESVAGAIDEEVKKLIDQAYAQCTDILKKDTDKLLRVVDYLMEHETMTGEQFSACMEGKEIAEGSSTSLFDGFENTDETENG
ncbi:MAG: ATP-dependent zinc metalloprotease FtsH [Clostridiales bacterium]|nr:ATP-dependent zinc metalloprotease FtsH [Clostridiales bacterium]MDD7387723.1 ATP-dependent zinc metalloprotease FtsH [Bacillota bacterium]MDY6040678.1 ATP-dependent zinc metalloprotease FtsH [Candidatus Faecousia sp.]